MTFILREENKTEHFITVVRLPGWECYPRMLVLNRLHHRVGK